jgi:hypothetical protein
MASPTLAIDPSDVARRVVESNLRVVWRGSLRVNLSICVYVYVYVTVKCGGIVGGGGTVKQFLLINVFVIYLLEHDEPSNVKSFSLTHMLQYYISDVSKFLFNTKSRQDQNVNT